MIRFLIIYLSVYTAAHFYAFHKMHVALKLSRKISVVIWLFVVAMIMAPVIVRLAERAGVPVGARFLAYVSFSWMGLLFLFLTISLVSDLLGLMLKLVGQLRNRTVKMTKISARQLLAIQAILVFGIYGYGLFEAATIRTEHLLIASPKIPAAIGRFRIVQISDVHLGLLVKEQRLSKILDAVKAASPDLLVATGDLVDGQLNNLSKEAKLLAAVTPPAGKIAITGNHEFYAGLQNALDFIKNAGFNLLRDQGTVIKGINFVGVDDPAVNSYDGGQKVSERDVLVAQSNENFTVLLKHRPAVDEASLGLFNLQLSGHTHKGQIFPFNIVTWMFYPFHGGQLTKLSAGQIYVSRGTGTWGPPIRFLAPPEVTIIDLVHKDEMSI